MKKTIRKDEYPQNGVLLIHGKDVTIKFDKGGFRYQIMSANGSKTAGYIPAMNGPGTGITISASSFAGIDPPLLYFTEFEGDTLDVEVIQ